MIFDTHAHYDDEAFETDRHEVIDKQYENGVNCIVNVGSDMVSSIRSIDLSKQYDFVYAAVGVHPNETGSMEHENIEELYRLGQNSKVVAVGEIGLDYYYKEPDHDIQKQWFIEQINLAQKLGKPIIVHSRDAAKDTLDIIKLFSNKNITGVIHCFSYTKEMAEEYVNMGFYIGIGGVITFKNAKKLREVVEVISIDNIVLETDCPYMAPEPNRGQRNTSLFIKYVAEEIGRIKSIPYDEVIRITQNNARRLYNMEEV